MYNSSACNICPRCEQWWNRMLSKIIFSKLKYQRNLSVALTHKNHLWGVSFARISSGFRIRGSDTSWPRSNLCARFILGGHCNGHSTSRSRVWIFSSQIHQLTCQAFWGGGGGVTKWETGARHILTQYQQEAYPGPRCHPISKSDKGPDPTLARHFLDQVFVCLSLTCYNDKTIDSDSKILELIYNVDSNKNEQIEITLTFQADW